jgi:hypothetical protein
MSDQLTTEGVGRRTVLKRSALIGGAMVWATPVVQSIAAPALAVGGTGTSEAISEVTLLIRCGTPGSYAYSWAKYNDSNPVPTECTLDMNVAQSNGPRADTVCKNGEAALKALIPAGSTAGSCINGTNTNGVLCIDAGSCTILGYTIHDGQIPGGNKCYYWANGTTGGSLVGGTTNFNFVVTQTGSTICFSKVPKSAA